MPEPETLPGSDPPILAAKLAALAALVDAAGSVADRGLCLLRIGEASYALFTSIADPRLWDAPLRYAHGALNEALLLLSPRQSAWVASCHRLGVVCRDIADWTADLTTARRSEYLLKQALQHPAIAALEDAGLVDVSGALLRTELLLDELEEPASAEQAELAARLSPGFLDASGLRQWLAETYDVEAVQPETAVSGASLRLAWERVAALLLPGWLWQAGNDQPGAGSPLDIEALKDADSAALLDRYLQLGQQGHNDLRDALALQLNGRATTRAVLGQLVDAANDASAAIDLYLELIDEGRDDLRDALALALNVRGAVWAGSGRIAEAVADYDAALVAHRATG